MASFTNPSEPLYKYPGDCVCGRVSTLLYRVPGANDFAAPVCAKCLIKLGLKVPKRRTAADLLDDDETVLLKPKK